MTEEGKNFIPEDESQITPVQMAQFVYGELDPRYYTIINAWERNPYYEDPIADIARSFTPGMTKRYGRYKKKIKEFLKEVWKDADKST